MWGPLSDVRWFRFTPLASSLFKRTIKTIVKLELCAPTERYPTGASPNVHMVEDGGMILTGHPKTV